MNISPPSLDQRRPKVSVSMITYNQERYIAEAIQSALKQDTDFEFEIVIGEDNSTDSTRSICRDFQARHPDKVRLLERQTNFGAVRNYYETYKSCRGQYVAFLEGDDFWIDAKKLQRQVNFLDANPDYAVCFHNVYLTDKNSKLGDTLFSSLPDTSSVFDLCKGEYISTPSCMVRNSQFGTIPDWLYGLAGADWPFDILHAGCGKIKCLPNVMSAYRRHDASIWSSVAAKDQHLIAIKLAEQMNEGFGHKYEKEFKNYIARNYACLALLHDPEAARLVIGPSAILKNGIVFDPKANRSALRKWFSPHWRKVKPHLKRIRLKAAAVARIKQPHTTR